MAAVNNKTVVYVLEIISNKSSIYAVNNGLFSKGTTTPRERFPVSAAA